MRNHRAIFAIFLLCACVARADDRPLEQRIKNPDMSQSPGELQTKKFQSTGSLKIGKASLGEPTFNANKKANTQAFETRSFLGINNPWFGKKVYKTNKASDWSRTIVTNVDRQYQVKDAETRPYAQAKKKADEPTAPVKTKKTELKGTAQGSLNAYSEKATRDLTIDDIRQLLNKE